MTGGEVEERECLREEGVEEDEGREAAADLLERFGKIRDGCGGVVTFGC